MKPEELLFAKTHEWVHVDEVSGAKIATIGISAFAVEALTDLVYMELPEVGRDVKSGEAFGEIESVKAVSDIYSPVDGTVTEVLERPVAPVPVTPRIEEAEKQRRAEAMAGSGGGGQRTTISVIGGAAGGTEIGRAHV